MVHTSINQHHPRYWYLPQANQIRVAKREKALDWIGYALVTDSLWIAVLTPNRTKFNAKPLPNQSCAPSLKTTGQLELRTDK